MPDSLIEAPVRDPAALAAAWAAYRQENPKVRIRDAAAALGVSEGELVASGVRPVDGSGGTIRLQRDWKALVEALPSLGRVMALTRNEHCVHEKVGRYDRISINAHGGVTLDPHIDLRLFFGRWKHAFLVAEVSGRQSIQIFGRDGVALHKIYQREESDAEGFGALADRFADADQSPGMAVEPEAPAVGDRPDTEIDRAGLEEGWRALQDTHDFFALLKRHKAGRTQAFRLVPDELAREVPRLSLSRALELAAAEEMQVMVFVGSPGVIQIHTGPVQRVQRMGLWQNVLDPGFNLHLKETGIASCWLIRKPTVDGIVTSLEIYDAAGQQIAWMFGKRKPGQPEDPAWPLLAERAAAEAAGLETAGAGTP